MVTPSNKIRSRLEAGLDLSLKSVQQLAEAEKVSIDELLGRDLVEPAPAAYRKKPLYFVARQIGLSQQELADKSGLSLAAIHHAFRGDDIRLSTAVGIADALKWPIQDVADILMSPVGTMDGNELAKRLAKIDLSLAEKAKALKVSDRTLRRWLLEGRPIPPAIKDELDILGW